ncbi:hypothetical protein B0H17DRAFT_1073044 [Mycena rosella]|uniref:DUF6534 domain-containing protein n=1 Tax=Mycena rosella TaxID=1033263 RepID=A0AAD7GEX4_MYCRO|nr:hypothetical protein B0H17DRAFT_1073044 [Mycena rosella]
MPTQVVLTLAGPLFIGVILVWALLGSLIIQLYDYHNTSRSSDRLWVQILVYMVFLLDLLQTVLITQSSWIALIVNWGDATALINTPWSSATTPLLNGLLAACVQCFFAWRIWQLTHSTIGRGIAIVIVALALMQLAAAAAVTAEYTLFNRDYSRLPELSHADDTRLIGNFICDTVIATSMVIILAKAHRQSHFKATETLLNRLIVNTIETAAITAGVTLLTLILFKVSPATYYDIVTDYVSGRIYSNVLVATLNGRHRSRNGLSSINNFGTVDFAHGTEMNTFTAAQHTTITTVSGQLRGVAISTTVDTNEMADRSSLPKVTAI